MQQAGALNWLVVPIGAEAERNRLQLSALVIFSQNQRHEF